MEKQNSLFSFFSDRKNLKYSIVLLVLLVVATVVRFAFLDNRPVHHDEGVNGWFVDRMFENHYYNYDVENYHGPLFFYLLQISEVLFGRNIAALRLVTAFFSVLSIILVMAHQRFFGKAALWAAIPFALSPAFLFYSRYAIHETVFIFFQIVFSYGFFSAVKEGRHRRGLAIMLAGFLGSYAVKETFFIFYASWMIAALLALVYEKIVYKRTVRIAAVLNPRQKMTASNVVLYCLTGFFAITLVYTDFFRYLPDFKDMVLFYAPWTKTGFSTFHAKHFLYYVSLLLRYEWMTLVAALLSATLFFFSNIRLRFWALLGFGLLLAYSLISYKTPWLILSALWPFAFAFGFGFDFLLNKLSDKSRDGKKVVIALGCAFLAVSAFLAIRVSFFKNADQQEHYVYTHTDRFISDIMEILDKTTCENALLKDMPITVSMRETWPLPWLLEKRGTVSWGGMGENAMVIFADESDGALVQSVMTEPYFVLSGRLRDSYSPILVYLKQSVFTGSTTGDLYVPGDTP